MFQNQRIVFEGLAKKYHAYLKLYAEWNNGSVEGATRFDEFYWRFSYHVKYNDPNAKMHAGY